MVAPTRSVKRPAARARKTSTPKAKTKGGARGHRGTSSVGQNRRATRPARKIAKPAANSS